MKMESQLLISRRVNDNLVKRNSNLEKNVLQMNSILGENT